MHRRRFLIATGSAAGFVLLAGCQADPERVYLEHTQEVRANPEAGEYIVNIEGNVDNNNNIEVGVQFRVDLLVDGGVMKEKTFHFDSLTGDREWSHTFILSASDAAEAENISTETELLTVWDPTEETVSEPGDDDYY